MKPTKLSHAIRLVLAAQVGVGSLVTLSAAEAQQPVTQPASVQGSYVNFQAPQPVYRQVVPQQQVYAQPQPVYRQVAPKQLVYQQPQQVYQASPPRPQVVYQQPQPAYQSPPVYQQPQVVYAQQPVMPQYAQPGSGQPQQYVMQSAPRLTLSPQAMVQPRATYPQGAVIYPQSAQQYVQPSQVPYGNTTLQPQAPAYSQGTIPQGMVLVNPGMQQPLQQGAQPVGMPSAQAPMLMYTQTGAPVPYQQPRVMYAYPPGQAVQGSAPQMAAPQGAAAAPVAQVIPAAASSQAAATAVSMVPGATDPMLAERPRRQTGSLSKLDVSPGFRPEQTLTAADLQSVNAVNVESAIQRLPQAIPALDRSSNNPGNGRATVDLRGLGTRRTAVLVNGMPFVAYGSEGVADLNAIPQGLLKQVDVTTGGASVAYGSGAVAGAINFVLDENFQGSQVSVSHQSADGGGGLSSADLTLGTSLGGRGNFAVNFGFSEREALFLDDREATTFIQFDDVAPNGDPILINAGSSGVPGTSIFAGALGDFSPSFGAIFDPDGSIRPFETGENNDFYNYAPANYLQIPQTRKHLTLLGNIQVNDSMEFYGLGMFSESETAIQLAATPIFQSGVEFTLDGSPFLTQSSLQVLSDAFGNGIDTDGDGIDDTATAFLRRRLLESGPRRSTTDSSSAYAQFGLRGNLGDNLEYDLYASRGSVRTDTTQEGNVSRDRFQQALLLDLQADPNGGVCQQTTSDTTNVPCAPINIFGEGNISQAGADFIAGGVAIDSSSTQNIYGARVTGTFDGLPAGEARLTLGAERQDTRYDQRYILTNFPTQGTQAGFNAGSDFGGQTSAESVYADLYVPLISDARGAEVLDVELGYRLTDYTTSKGVASYGANVSWAPMEFARVRAGYNRAHRAPSIGELFAPQSEGFPGASDPCSASGSGGFISQEQAAICVATGVPSGLVGSAALNLPSGQVRAISGGNPNLEEEQADTFFAGVEFAVPLSEEGSLRAGIDYFLIEGSQGIAPFGGGANNVLSNCYDPNTSSAEAPNEFCDVISRRPDGSIDFVEITSQNNATFELEGLDIFAGVAMPVMGGSIGVDYNATVYNSNRSRSSSSADWLECAGVFGDLCGEPIPTYSHIVSAGWSFDRLGAKLIWRHLGEVSDDDDASLYFVEKIGAKNYLDAEVSLDLAGTFELAAGVQNLTNTGQPILGNNQEQANTFPATYDVYGRTYFVRLTGTTGE